MINIASEPYNDDFSEDKQFYQLLFKPGLSLQARELTQLQSILKDQIKKFGNHIFQHGSIVIPGNSLSDLFVPYIKINSQFGPTNIIASDFLGKTIVGQTTGVKAIVKKTIGADVTDPIVFYLSYISGNVTTGIISFEDGETVTIENDTTSATLISTSATGLGSMAFVNKGVYYINGTFVSVNEQSIVISKFTSVPSCRVLLKIKEEIIDNIADESLLDNAQGSPNYAAPGADRFKISLELTSLDLSVGVTSDYVEIMRFNNGELEEHARNPKYSVLEKSLARRTFDESGNYVVNGLEPKLREHLRESNNDGVYFSSGTPAGDISKLVVEVSPGKTYINGFEIDKPGKTRIVIDKARSAEHIKETTAILRPEYGQYLYISSPTGVLGLYDHETVTIWNDNDASNGAATQIGTAKVLAIDYCIGDVIAGAIYKLWVTDITMTGSYSIANAGGIRYSGSGYAFVITKLNVPITSGSFTAGVTTTHATSGRTATIQYWDTTTANLYVYKHDHTKEVPAIGDLIVDSATATTGNVTSRETLVSIGQAGLLFQLPAKIPATLKNLSSVYDLDYTVQKELIITTNGSGAGSVVVSSGTIDPIEPGTFVAIGPTGIIQYTLFSLNIGGTTLSIAGGPISSTIRIYCSLSKPNVNPKTKTVSTLSEVITTPGSGTITLKKTDIISITSIIDTVGDITANYTMDNGQTDYSYNRGTLTLKLGKSAAVGNVTVNYSYYLHSIGGDFFCVDSYNTITNFLDTVSVYQSKSTKIGYDLASVIDFRPSVGEDGTFTGTGSRRNDPFVSGNVFTTKLQYYVPRIDSLVVDSSGKIIVLQGTPSTAPKIPTISDTQFELYRFFLPAYTRLVDSVVISKMDIKRYTMGDINKTVRRISNIEDYMTLTGSESKIVNFDVIDATTGLNRFKTGYIVEDFINPFNIAYAVSPDFKITFVGSSMQSVHEQANCPMTLDVASSSNYINKNGYLMLPYTEVVFAAQKLSSRTTNINPFLMIKWLGVLGVVPASDTWVEIRDDPQNIFESTTETVDVVRYVSCPSYGGGYSSPPAKAGLINTLYQNILGRSADSGGLSQWTNTWNETARGLMVNNGFTPEAAFSQATIQVGTAIGNTPLPQLGGATERSVYETSGTFSAGNVATTSVQSGILAAFAGIVNGQVSQIA